MVFTTDDAAKELRKLEKEEKYDNNDKDTDSKAIEIIKTLEYIKQKTFDLYHKFEKGIIWRESIDTVCDMCEEYVHKVIDDTIKELKIKKLENEIENLKVPLVGLDLLCFEYALSEQEIDDLYKKGLAEWDRGLKEWNKQYDIIIKRIKELKEKEESK